MYSESYFLEAKEINHFTKKNIINDTIVTAWINLNNFKRDSH